MAAKTVEQMEVFVVEWRKMSGVSLRPQEPGSREKSTRSTWKLLHGSDRYPLSPDSLRELPSVPSPKPRSPVTVEV